MRLRKVAKGAAFCDRITRHKASAEQSTGCPSAERRLRHGEVGDGHRILEMIMICVIVFPGSFFNVSGFAVENHNDVLCVPGI